MRDKVLSQIPDRDELASGDTPLNLSIENPFLAEKSRLDNHIDNRELAAIVDRYPVRESGVLNAIARELRFRHRSDYERSALKAIGDDSALQDSLRGKLGKLGGALGIAGAVESTI